MIQTIVTPNNTDLDISIKVPESYVGRPVHVLFYTDDEVKNTTVSVPPAKKPSDFFGTLSIEDGEKLQEYVNKSRSEWERDF